MSIGRKRIVSLTDITDFKGITLKVLTNMLYESNKREQQHSARVSQLCTALGTALGLCPEKIEELHNAGLLHDIGKIVIDNKILEKPGKLSDLEFAEIKRHAETGYRILSSVKDWTQLAEYVWDHHERWDGQGYPRGLKGNEIPLQARIIAVADAYDAMTSNRPYRKALSLDSAIKEIRNNAGCQFDPEVSRVFLENIKKWYYI
jgi:uncharacterized domain HDIG